VVSDEAVERCGVCAVEAEVGEGVGGSEFVEMGGEGVVFGDVVTPDDGISDYQGLVLGGGDSGASLVEPVVAAECQGYAIVGAGLEFFGSLP